MYKCFCRYMPLYCALFWIQGKTVGAEEARAAGLYCALFWIQGKTHYYR